MNRGSHLEDYLQVIAYGSVYDLPASEIIGYEQGFCGSKWMNGYADYIGDGCSAFFLIFHSSTEHSKFLFVRFPTPHLICKSTSKKNAALPIEPAQATFLFQLQAYHERTSRPYRR